MAADNTSDPVTPNPRFLAQNEAIAVLVSMGAKPCWDYRFELNWLSRPRSMTWVG